MVVYNILNVVKEATLPAMSEAVSDAARSRRGGIKNLAKRLDHGGRVVGEKLVL
jgi:hypothetical protein